MLGLACETCGECVLGGSFVSVVRMAGPLSASTAAPPSLVGASFLPLLDAPLLPALLLFSSSHCFFFWPEGPG